MSSLTLNEERRLRIFEGDIWTWKLKKTDNGENFKMISFTAFTPQLMLSGWLNRGGWGRRDRVLVGRPGGGEPPGIPRHRWEVNVKTDLRETGIWWSDPDEAGSGLSPVAGFCEHCDEPSGSMKNVTSLHHRVSNFKQRSEVMFLCICHINGFPPCY